MKQRIIILAVLLLSFVSLLRAETDSGRIRNVKTVDTEFVRPRHSAGRIVSNGNYKRTMSVRGLQNQMTSADGKIIYVVLDNSTGTLTFTYQEEKPIGDEVYVGCETTYIEQIGTDVPMWIGTYSYNSESDSCQYVSNSENVKKVVFDASFADARPTSTHSWFYGCTNLIEIEGIEYLNTSEVTDMSLMFFECSNLETLDVSSFSTQNVTTMEAMFYDCENLASLDVSHFNTANVTEMGWLFWGCSSLTSLDVSNFNTSKVTRMYSLFCYCENLTTLDVSHFDMTNVTEMPYMFYSCYNLSSISLPTNMNSIGNYAFSYCNSLTSITIPANVTYIGYNAYAYCRDLDSLILKNVTPFEVGTIVYPSEYSYVKVIVPAGTKEQYRITNGWNYFSYILEEGEEIEYADGSMFRAMTEEGINVTYKVLSNTEKTCEVVQGSNQSLIGDLIIPNNVNGFRVTSIGNSAFSGCSGLTSVIIPAGVTSIGNSAFYGCSRLMSVTIPASVTSIGNSAFSQCSELTSITIPANVTSIGEDAFYCSNLETVTSLIENPFDCYYSFLSDIFSTLYVPAGTKALYREKQGWNNFIVIQEIGVEQSYADGDVFYAVTEEGVKMVLKVLSADEKTCQVGEGNYRTAISYSTEGDLTIPSSVNGFTVVGIGSYAFNYSYYLTSVTIPASVTSIGNSAFSGCSGLTSVIIPASVTSIGNNAFYACNSLTSITIPASVTSIGNDAFYSCNDLDSIILKVEIPFEVGTIVSSSDNSYVKVIVPTGTKNQYRSTNGWSNFRYILEEGEEIEYADGDVFRATTEDGIKVTYKILSVEDKTCQVGDGNGNRAINTWIGGEFVVPNNVNGFTVVAISANAFSNVGMTSLTIPASISNIEERAINGCYNLQTLTVESGNKVYDSRGDCNAIIETATNTLLVGCMNTVIPGDVTSIGGYAFYDVYELESITIPNGVTSIGISAFQYCSNMTSVTIPASVTTIGDYAFAYCSNLSSVTMENKVPATIGSSSFLRYSYSNLTRTLYVPVKSLEAYTSVVGWDVFDDYIRYGKANLTIDDTGQGLFCSDIDLDFSGIDGVTAYIATAVNNTEKTVLMTQVTAVPAGTGVYIVGTPGIYEIPYVKTSAYSTNMLKGNIESTPVHPIDGEKINYNLTIGSSTGFVPIVSTQVMAASTAYLQIPTSIVGYPDETDLLTIVFSDDVLTVMAEKNDDQQEKKILKLSDLSYTLPSKKSVYNGRAFYATIKNAADFGTVHIYYTDAYGNKTETSPVEIGTYTISFEIEESDLYYAKTFSDVLTFTIKKNVYSSDLSYTLPDKEIVYDGLEHYATISNASDYGVINIYYINSKGYRSLKHPVEPDTYSVRFEIEESEQYYSNYFTVGSFTIFEGIVITTEEFNALKAVYDQMKNTNKWTNKWIFNETTPVKSVLPGVTVKDKHITEISLSENNLSGEFPIALLRLPYLTKLNLYSNSNLTGDLGQQMAAYIEQNPTATFALQELNIGRCNFSGNIGVFAQPLTNLTSLKASYNSIEEVYPMISSTVKTLDITYQSLLRVVELDLEHLTPEYVATKMPSVILYNHKAQSYVPSQLDLKCSTTDDSWSMTIRYQNGQVTIPSVSSQIYSGTSGDGLKVRANYESSTMPAQNSTFSIALSFDQGDSNFDGDVNVLDLQTIINYMFEECNTKIFNFTASDLWQDDVINVQDAVCLVNILLETEGVSEQEPSLARGAMSTTYDYMAASYIEDGQLVINSLVPVSSFDIVIETDNQIEIAEALGLTGIICMEKRNGNKTHLVGYSFSGAALPVGKTPICKLGRGSLKYVMLSDSEAQEIRCAVNDIPTSLRTNRLEDSSSEVYRLPIGARRSIVIGADGRKTIKKDTK